MLKTELEIVTVGTPDIAAIPRITKPSKALTDSCAYVMSTPSPTTL